MEFWECKGSVFHFNCKYIFGKINIIAPLAASSPDEYDQFPAEVRVLQPAVDLPCADGTWLKPAAAHCILYFFHDIPAFQVDYPPGVFPFHPGDEPVE